MASFNININAEIVQEYTVTANHLFKASDCTTPISLEHPIGLIEDTATLDPAYHLLSSYTDASSWKTLKIKNIVYSHPTTVYLSDTLVKIPEAGAVVYDFDVTGQAVDIAIPNLTLTYDTYTPINDATITFDLAIENLALEVGDYQSVTLLISHSVCPSPPGSGVSLNNVTPINCNTTGELEVLVPAEGERRVVIIANDGFGFTAQDTTITTDTTFNLTIFGDNTTGTGTNSQLVCVVYASSTSTTVIDSKLMARLHSGNLC